MAWPLVISAAVSVAGGIMSKNASDAEAQRAEQYAAYNAANQAAWGLTQSRLTMMTSMYNAMNMKKQAEFNAQQNTAWIEYNAGIARETNAYNDLLYDDQVDQIFEAADLNTQQLHKDYLRARGTTVGQQASSGITIGEGSHQDVINDQTAEEALFTLIIGNNAQKEANSILNAKAQGAWQTEQQIQKMRYEGQLANASALYGANADANATLFGGAMNAFNQQQGANNQAISTINQGQQVSANQQAAGNMALTQGLMQGASYGAKAYGQYSLMNPSTEPEV